MPTISASYSPTGRHITADADYALARSWAESNSLTAIRNHRAKEHFDSLLAYVARVKEADNFLSKVFWHAELSGNDDVAFGFEFSQVVASLVARRFDGMVVPGVRGLEGNL